MSVIGIVKGSVDEMERANLGVKSHVKCKRCGALLSSIATGNKKSGRGGTLEERCYSCQSCDYSEMRWHKFRQFPESGQKAKEKCPECGGLVRVRTTGRTGRGPKRGWLEERIYSCVECEHRETRWVYY